MPTPTIVDGPAAMTPVVEEDSDHRVSTTRNSPEAGTADVHGQYVDPTSGLSFLYRARRRFSSSHGNAAAEWEAQSPEYVQQPLIAAGDKPLLGDRHHGGTPAYSDAVELLDLYFDVCVATYRILHRPSVQSWLDAASPNRDEVDVNSRELGRARAAILLGVLAIATFNRQKSRGFSNDEDSMTESDCLIQEAMELTTKETGLPTSESIQARVLQVFYLLMTCRFNRAWYTIGMSFQMISAMGLHRRSSRRRGMPPADYMQDQIQKRIFWSAYILDRYIGVVLGRPPHFYDEEIDQDLPDRVNDEDITRAGPQPNPYKDCSADAFVFNARLAEVVGSTSRLLYGIREASETERIASIFRLRERIDEWHSAVPAFLSTVKPSTLVRSFRRQAVALRLAHCHAVMHLFRPLLLGHPLRSQRPTDRSLVDDGLRRCIFAAQSALELVDDLAHEGPTFHAFWWTHYVTFCALAIVYVWKLQSRRSGFAGKAALDDDAGLLVLAERCQQHLASATASNSPSRRYSIILEELRNEAQKSGGHRTAGQPVSTEPSFNPLLDQAASQTHNVNLNEPGQADLSASTGSTIETPDWLATWQNSDWLDLDASAFGAVLDFSPDFNWTDAT